MNRLTLSLLGPIQVVLDGKPVTEWRYDKLRALLSFLAVEAGQPHRRTSLADLLWPDVAEEAARTNLRQALASLRTVICDRAAQPPFLLIDRESIRWNPDASAWLDVAAFETLLHACRQHAHRRAAHCGPCAERYRQAVELYRGDFLADFFLPDSAPFEDWAVRKREGLRRQMMEALAALAAFYEQQGSYEQAAHYVRRQLALEPWLEDAHRCLMRVLALNNQRSHALAHYEQCRRILADELGVEPAPETVALVEQIQLGLQAPPEQAPPEQGTPVRLAAGQPHNLPPQSTPFVGRERELREIAALLNDPACRLLTLTGAGGIGKTRLALQAAGAQAGAFRDGVFFAPLASVASSDLLVNAIGEAIGCPFTSRQRPRVQLLSFLRDKELLLVLDNFEHLMPEANLLAEIGAAAPAVSLLVTSRERLSLQGEWLFPVHGLPYPPLKAQPEGSGEMGEEEYGALQLFLQTAVRLQPGFRLGQTDAPWVARICQLVEGMPLAIELAAAWVRVLSLQEIAQEIERSLALLAGNLRDVPERHRSLRVVFDHSWQLLAPQEQDVFRQLSVFRGGCERAAAEQVAGAALPLLAALVDKSLLRRSAAGRYEMHEHLRLYGAEKLQERGQTAATQDRHLTYYLNLAEIVEPHLQETHSTERMDQLQAESDNLRAALAWSLAGGDPEAGLRLAVSLWLFWWVRGYTGEGRGWLAALLQKTPAAPPAQRAKALRAAGGLAYYQTDLVQAEQYFAAALQLFRQEEDRQGISRALRNLSVVQGEQGKYDEALVYGEESVAIARALGDVQNLANALSNVGVLNYYLGNHARALLYLEEGLALNRTLDDQHDIAIQLHNLAEVLAAAGDTERALQLYAESEALFRATESNYGVGFSLQAQGDLRCAQGDLPQAWQLLQQALALFRQLGDRQGMGLVLLGLASLAMRQGRLDHAATLLGALDRLLAEGSVAFKPPDRSRAQRAVAAAQAQLPAEQFTAAWAAGGRLHLEAALDRALAQEPPSNPSCLSDW